MVSPTLWNGQTFGQSILTRSKAATKSILLQHVPTTAETLRLFYGIGYVSSCVHDRRLHAKLHLKTNSQTGVAVQLMTRAWSVLAKSFGWGNVLAAYYFYFIYDGKKALLIVMMSRGDGSSSVLQRTLRIVVGRTVKTEVKVDRAAWRPFVALNHAMRLLRLQFFSHFHALLGHSAV